MKKYILFSISFVISFVVFQSIYGYFLSLFYTPDSTSAWSQVEGLPSNVVMKGSSSFVPLLFISFLAVIIAYFTPKLFMKKSYL